MYCTELVWKLYKRILDVELGRLNILGDFNLTHPGIQALLKERYGDNNPESEIVISQAELFSAEVLETVYENTGR